MSDNEYNSLYYSLKDNRKRELKKMLFEFGIKMTSCCKKDDYIRELIYCLDNLHDNNEDS